MNLLIRTLTTALLGAWIASTPVHAQEGYFDVGELTSSFLPDPYGSGIDIDLGSDGDLDLVYLVRGDLVVLENDGAGNLTRREDLHEIDPDQLLDWPRDVAVADFNGDGRDDLFVADHGDEPAGVDWRNWPGGQSQIFIQSEDGRLVEETTTRFPAETSFTHATAVGDITGNGAPDIYLASYVLEIGTEPRARFYINDGTGHFTSEPDRIPTKAHGGYPASALADVDQDGDLDLILGGTPFDARDLLLLNDGTGNFTEAPAGSLPLRYAKSEFAEDDFRESEWATWNVEAADFNNDGYPDLAMGTLYDFTSTETYENSNEWEETRIQLLLNNQDGTFRDATDLIPQHYPRLGDAQAWIMFSFPVDLNADGFMDLVSLPEGAGTRLFYNVGGEYFVDATADVLPELAEQGATLAPGDFTGDGRTDLVVLPSVYGPGWYAKQTSAYTFDTTLRPTISDISPASGAVGTVVTVSGTNLSRTVRAFVGETETAVQVLSDAEVNVTIPEGAHDGPIVVMSTYGSASSTPFNVIQAPVITRLSQQSGIVGTEITISGSYFTGATSVTFNGVEAAFTIVSDQELNTTVPEGATSGPLRVATSDGEVSADFTVMTPPPADAALAFSGAVAVAPGPSEAPELNLGGAFTMETWVYLDEAPQGVHFMGKPHPTSEAPWTSYQLGIRDGRLALEQSSGAGDSHRWVQAPGAAPTGRWMHVAGTLASDTLRIYVDGEEVAWAESAGPSDNGATAFTLGSAFREGGLFAQMNGRMREASVWNRALRAEEVRQVATRSLSGSEEGLIAYWPLDEGSGSVAADHGPNGYDLTLGLSDGSSAPTWLELGQTITTISDARSESGTVLTVEGILSTPDFGYTEGMFHVQDETGGLFVYSPNVGGAAGTDVSFSAGDRVRITGEIGAYAERTQITLASYEILEAGQVPEPVDITVSDFTSESTYQGRRVRLSDLTLAENSGWPTEPQTSGAAVSVTFVTSGGDSLIARIDRGESFYDGSTRPAGVVDLTGTLDTYRGTPQLWVFFEGDVQQQTGTDRMEQEPISSLTLTSFPNPFRERATLRFELPAAGEVIVEVYDLLGRRIAAPVRGWHEAGSHEVTFEAASRPSGLYHAVIMAGGHREHASLLLAR